MLENLYTTKMSMSRKRLQERLAKIRFKGGKRGKIIGFGIIGISVLALAIASVFIAVNLNRDKGDFVKAKEPVAAADNSYDLIQNALAEDEEILVNSGVRWVVDAKKAREAVKLIGREGTTKNVKLKDGNYEVIIYSVHKGDSASPKLFLLLNGDNGEVELALSGDLSEKDFSRIVNYLEETDKEFSMEDLKGMLDATLVIDDKRYSTLSGSPAEVEKLLLEAKMVSQTIPIKASLKGR